MGISVGSTSVGAVVGCFVGVEEFAFVGDCVWSNVGLADGDSVGFMTGD